MNQNKRLPGVLLAMIFLAVNLLTACAPLPTVESTLISTVEAASNSTPTQINTPTLTQTPTPAPSETPVPTKTQEPTPQPTETEVPEQKEYPLGCFDPEINAQAITDYLLAHPEFNGDINAAMQAHIEKYGKENVFIGAASYQGSETQEESQIHDPLPLKYTVIKFPDETADIRLGCVTFAYPRYEKNGEISVGTVNVFTDVEIDGKWSGSPFLCSYDLNNPNGVKIFSKREEFQNWLFLENDMRKRNYRLMITSGKKDLLWTSKESVYLDSDAVQYFGSLLEEVTIPNGDLENCYINFLRNPDNWSGDLNPLSVDPEAYQKFIADLIQKNALPRQAGLFLLNVLLK